MIDRFILEWFYRGDTVIFIVDEASPVLGEWQDGPYAAREESALYRQMLASRAIPDDHPDDDDGPRTVKEEYLLYQEMVGNITSNQCAGAVHSPAGSAPERCALPEGHEGKCEP